MKRPVSLADMLLIHAACPEIPINQVKSLCGRDISADKPEKTREKPRFDFIKLEQEIAVVTRKPPLVMTENQLAGKDLQGGHAAVMRWLDEIKKSI